jgi:hypothetical protein
MPHPPARPIRSSSCDRAIPEICPPGEGMACQIDKIFWETKQAS